MINHDEREQHNMLALGAFKNAKEVKKSVNQKDQGKNPLYLYYLARQHLELRQIKEALQYAGEINLKNISVKNENILLSLKALVNISKHNYDQAYDMLSSFIKRTKTPYKNYTVIVIM